jgi:hypothetical protein
MVTTVDEELWPYAGAVWTEVEVVVSPPYPGRLKVGKTKVGKLQPHEVVVWTSDEVVAYAGAVWTLVLEVVVGLPYAGATGVDDVEVGEP